MRWLAETRWLEESFEFLLGFIVLALCVYFQFPDALPQNFTDILAQSISVSSIIVGFLVASKSILIALDDKPIVIKLKATGKYSLIVKYFMRAIIVSFIWAISSGTLLFLPSAALTTFHHAIIAAWFGLTATSISSCGKIIWLLGGVLKS
jgi:hypothetical protein